MNNVTIRRVDLCCSNGLIRIIDAVRLSSSFSSLNLQSTSDGTKKAIIVNEAYDEIPLAIHRRVLLANGGKEAACAETYEICIKSLASPV